MSCWKKKLTEFRWKSNSIHRNVNKKQQLHHATKPSTSSSLLAKSSEYFWKYSSSKKTKRSRSETNSIICIVEGRGSNSGQLGIAAINFGRPEIEVCQFNDTSGYNSTLMKMLIWMPIDVLVPHSALEPSSNMNRLVRLLRQSEFGCNIIGINRHLFNYQQGIENLKRLCHPHYLSSIYAFQEKFYGLAAVSALLSYLETTKKVYYASKSLKVNFGCSSQATLLDATSALRLNLVGRFQRSHESQSLFAAINHTCTLSGGRRLRAALLEPPNDLNTIKCRQQAVAELVSKPQILLEIQNALMKFPAIDSLLSTCVQLSDFPTPSSNPVSVSVTQEPILSTSDDPDLVISLSPSSGVSNDDDNCERKRRRYDTISTINSTSKQAVLSSNLMQSSSKLVSGKMKLTTAGSATVERSSHSMGNSDSNLLSAVVEKNAEIRITKLISIKYMLDMVRPLHDALIGCSSSLLSTYKKILTDRGYEDLLQKMTTVLHQDVCVSKGSLQMRVQKCFAIKSGINVLLDLTRQAYAEQVDDISQLVKNLATEQKLPLRVGYNKTRGFFIQIPEASISSLTGVQSRKNQTGNNNTSIKCDYFEESTSSLRSNGSSQFQSRVDTFGLSNIFIKIQSSRGLVNCTTAELVKLNERVKGSLNEVYMIADKLIHDLHPEMSLFYRLSEVVSALDLLCSLAKIVVSAPPGHLFVKPVFGDTLAIQEGRHMVKDRFSDSIPIANNIFSSSMQNCTIVLGPSMSGKSTYLSQIALIQILGQIGSFVPAKFAALRLTDRIFVRMGSRDDMYTNASTFTLEMREVGHILRSATDNSLILIDDLGLSTTDEDCFSLSYAICDGLSKMRAFSFFTSSDNELARLQFLHENIEICHLLVEFEGTVNQQGRFKNRHNLSSPPISEDSLIASPPFRLQSDSSSFPQSSPRQPKDSGMLNNARKCYHYTYKLHKGVGTDFHLSIDLLGLAALSPRLLKSTYKFAELLLHDKPNGTEMDETANKIAQHAENIEINVERKKLETDVNVVNSIGSEKSLECSLASGLKSPTALLASGPAAFVSLDIPSTGIPMPTAQNHSTPNDDNKTKITMLDRSVHKLIQQIQMVACVFQTVDNLSKETSDLAVQARLRSAEQDAMTLLRFLRDRYDGIFKALKED